MASKSFVDEAVQKNETKDQATDTALDLDDFYDRPFPTKEELADLKEEIQVEAQDFYEG